MSNSNELIGSASRAQVKSLLWFVGTLLGQPVLQNLQYSCGSLSGNLRAVPRLVKHHCTHVEASAVLCSVVLGRLVTKLWER